MAKDDKNIFKDVPLANRPKRKHRLTSHDPEKALLLLMNGLAETVLEASEEELAEELDDQGVAQGEEGESPRPSLFHPAQDHPDIPVRGAQPSDGDRKRFPI